MYSLSITCVGVRHIAFTRIAQERCCRFRDDPRLESDVMRDTEWLDAFDERLEDVTERWMRARWADFTHEQGAAVGALQRERGALLTDGATRQQLASLRNQDLDAR